VQYIQTLLDLITGDGVRFHLQHLALQMLGHANPPTDEEVDLTLRLLAAEPWANHVWGQVLYPHIHWFDALQQRLVIRNWLQGSDERLQNFALGLMRRSLEVRGEAITELLLPLPEDVRLRLLELVVAHIQPAQLPTWLFSGYLKLARRGSEAVEYIDWKRLSELKPQRAIRLLREYVLRAVKVLRESPDIVQMWANRQAISATEVNKGIASAAAAVPRLSWDTLTPCLLQFISKTRRPTRGASAREHNWYKRHELQQRIGRLLVQSLSAAGAGLASSKPNAFRRRVRSLHSRKSRVVDRLIAHSSVSMSNKHADWAIRWLLRRPARFRCGGGRRGGRGGAVYRPAVRLLARFSALCSDAVFKRLEAAVLRHVPASEREDFRYTHELFRGRSWLGETTPGVIRTRDMFLGQHLLLSALPPERLGVRARDWAGVLARKFGAAEKLLERPVRTMGGFVTSTIPADKLHLTRRTTPETVRTGCDWRSKPGDVCRRSGDHGPPTT
jgi:hypothetical protein